MLLLKVSLYRLRSIVPFRTKPYGSHLGRTQNLPLPWAQTIGQMKGHTGGKFREEPSRHKDNDLSDAREKSLQNYLTRREAERSLLFQKKVSDETRLFDERDLSHAEKALHETHKRISEAVEQHFDNTKEYSGYLLPSTSHVEPSTPSVDAFPRSTELPPKETDWEVGQTLRARGTVSVGPLLSTATVPRSKIERSDKINRVDAENQRRSAIKKVQQSLPVFAYKEQIIEAVNEFQVLILVGETGSGKTTQIPQYLFEAGYTEESRIIGCTQPRRVAAMSVAARVAEEMRVRLGYEVGYSIRFEDCTSEHTLLKYMTDGMLLREFLTDPTLSSYSALIIDEAHERTLHTDVLFGLVREISRSRKDLKIIISSATLDADKFSDYFDSAPIFTVPGRRYDVDIYYTRQPQPNYVLAAVKTCIQIHLTDLSGDILIFLTGQDEIEEVEEILNRFSRARIRSAPELIVAPIYANLSPELQSKIFAATPANARKVVLATNIAETSITIDGIVFVIDSGYVKQKTYNPKTGMESLIIEPCSRASVNQRAGRAGRVGPGKCFRLFTKWAYENELIPNTVPEIQRTNLGNVVLLLKSLGVNDLVNFGFMDPPSPQSMIRALEELYALGALNEKGELTKLGRQMSEFPLDPLMSASIIAAEKFRCLDEVIIIVSMLSNLSDLYVSSKNRRDDETNARKALWVTEGDHLTLLNIWNSWKDNNFASSWCKDYFLSKKSLSRSREVREQLIRLCEKSGFKITSSDDSVIIRKALLSGYFFHCATLTRSGAYRSIKHGMSIEIHPSSSKKNDSPKWIMYHELVLTTKEFVRCVSEIEPEWLLEIAPHFYSKQEINPVQKTGRSYIRS